MSYTVLKLNVRIKYIHIKYCSYLNILLKIVVKLKNRNGNINKNIADHPYILFIYKGLQQYDFECTASWKSY